MLIKAASQPGGGGGYVRSGGCRRCIESSHVAMNQHLSQPSVG